jgi:hypothetical protein
MDQRKRNFMLAILPVALVARYGLLEGSAAPQADGRHQRVQPLQQPPRTDVSVPDPPTVDPKLFQEENQKKIRENIQKLYALAGELKEQVERADSANVLSLSMIDKASKIEKLAKQIATLARG